MLARPEQKTSVLDIINAARALMPVRRRGANAELYSALVLALQASELCLADIEQDLALGKAVAELPRGNKNRQYVERRSDAYQRVCRYIFFGDEHTANINRYAIALREAGKQGVRSKDLLKYLNKGGVNQFYLKRPLHSDTISTRCIRLDCAIVHEKTAVVTLVLQRNDDNSYAVLDRSFTRPQSGADK
jgi:hypothetical protein